MKVRELIAALSAMPQEAEVRGYYESAARLDIYNVWLTQHGYVLLADNSDADWIRRYDDDNQSVASGGQP